MTVLVLPNSLFEDNELLKEHKDVIIYEHPVFFTDWSYHKIKLVLHRATMKYYMDFIKKKYKSKVTYINYNKSLVHALKKGKGDIVVYNPADHKVEADIKRVVRKIKKKLVIKDTPLFYSSLGDLKKFLGDKKTILHSQFYQYQRRRLNILMTKNKKPKGGKWSFDVQNRKPFPKNFKQNYIPKSQANKYITEAKKYVNKHFGDNPGSPDIYAPITHDGAKKHFKKFLKDRFKCFGPYQDAVDEKIPFGCHSIISPLLNIGLLTPKYVVTEAEKYGTKNRVPMQSLEGFIRQIIGWRESMYMLYMFKRTEMEKLNHFKHKRKLDKNIWYGTEDSSGFDIIDDMVDKTWKYGYLHHIERLMYIGNYFLINKIDPKECFDWFMTMFIDAYRWVMYGNVYAMSQYSTGKLLMTRPYFSSSSYITKMSNYTKNKNKYEKIELGGKEYEWFDVWDAIYYSFIGENRTEFKKNYAIAAQVRHWDNKTKKEQNELKKVAKLYMDTY